MNILGLMLAILEAIVFQSSEVSLFVSILFFLECFVVFFAGHPSGDLSLISSCLFICLFFHHLSGHKH